VRKTGLDVLHDLVEQFVYRKQENVVRIGEGEVFLIPGGAEPYHVVIHFGDGQWMCTCKGWRFMNEDRTTPCRHIKIIMKLVSKGGQSATTLTDAIAKEARKATEGRGSTPRVKQRTPGKDRKRPQRPVGAGDKRKRSTVLARASRRARAR
jgi:hypothetical protein